MEQHERDSGAVSGGNHIERNAAREKRRHPLLAGVLALLAPGLGHLYSGSPLFAFAWIAAAMVIVYATFQMLAYWNLSPMNVAVPVLVLVIGFLIHIGHAIWTAHRRPREYRLRPYNHIGVYVGWWLFAVLIWVFVRPMATDLHAYTIPSSSMENTLIPGDYILADHSAYDSTSPEKGDVIVFLFPADGVTKYISRCVATGGDTLEIRDKNLYINNTWVKDLPGVKHIDTNDQGEQNIQPRRSGRQNSRDNFGPYVVPEQSYFVMGDNRDNAYDSRYWQGVPRDLILGKALRIYYSKDSRRIGWAVK